MMLVRGLVLTTVALGWVPLLAAQAPSGVFHTPPTSAQMGEPILLEVTVEGVPEDEPRVVVFYRSQGASRYSSQELRPQANGTFQAEIAGAITRGLSLHYYVEVSGPQGSYLTRIGSERQPLSVLLMKPRKETAGDRLLQFGLSGLSVAFVVGLVLVRERSRRKAAQEDKFWQRTLGRATRLRGESLDRYLNVLAQRTLSHPVEGPRIYSTEQLRQKLEEMGGAVANPRERRDRPVRASSAALPHRPAIRPEQLKSRLRSLAARVGRLCSAAWLISRNRRNTDGPGSDFLKPFEATRRAVRQVQRSLDARSVEEAEALMDGLEEQTSQLAVQVAEVDEGRSVEELIRCLESMRTVTAEMLGRVLEYYALVAPRAPSTRNKLIAVATELARRDSLSAGDPGRMRSALRRRDLLEGRFEELDPALAQQFEEIKILLSVENPTEDDLHKLRDVVRDFGENLGDSLYGVEGLSHAVALALLLDERKMMVERTETGSFDSVAQDLEQVTERHVARMAATDSMEPEEHPDAFEMMRSIEGELQISLRDGELEQAGFYLEAFELDALTKPETDPGVAALVRRCVVCLTAMNRLAKRHSRASQLHGESPPPLPRSMAQTLIRRAAELYRDFQDLVEKELMRGQQLTAKEYSRFMHRLNRTRIGLALLGNIPLDG